MITVNAGSSRAILLNKHRKVRILTPDQHPNVPKERLRIEKTIGRIVQNKESGMHMLEYPKEGCINKEKVEFSRTLGNYSG